MPNHTSMYFKSSHWFCCREVLLQNWAPRFDPAGLARRAPNPDAPVGGGGVLLGEICCGQ